MIALICQNCGSHDLVLEGHLYRCQSCGAGFVPEAKEESFKKKIEKHRKKMMDAMEEADFEKAEKQRLKLLELDPEDPFAWTEKVWDKIGEGVDEHTREIIDFACTAVEFAKKKATEEEIQYIKDFMDHYIWCCQDRLIQCNPEREDDVMRILKWAEESR